MARYLTHVLALSVVALAAVAITWSPVRLDDQWWHMLTGRYVLEHGAVPTTDPFSYTMTGQPWVNWEWLAGVLMVKAYDGFGTSGLVALRWLSVTATAGLLWGHLSSSEPAREHAAVPLRLLLVSLVVLVVYGRVADRPHLYALPLLAAVHWLVSLALERRRLEPTALAVLLMVPWVLLHPSWPLGLAVVASAMIDAHMERPLSRRLLLAPVALALPALLLHSPVAYARAVQALFGSSGLREWKPLWAYLHHTNTPLLAFLLLGALWLGAVALRPARLKSPSTWLAACLFAASLWYVRFTPWFALACAPQLHRILLERAAERGDRVLPERTARLATVLVAAALLLVVVRTKSTFQHPYASHVDPRETPVGVAAFMDRHDIAGNVLCDEMNAHAYLAFARYPNVREFIDGRVPQLFDEAMWEAYVQALRSPARFTQLLDRPDTEWVVLSGVFTPRTAQLSRVLWERRDFRLVYFDDNALLWGRSSEPRFAFDVVVPPIINDGWFESALDEELFPRVLEELTHLRQNQPSSQVGLQLVATLAAHPAASPDQRAALAALR